MISKWTQHLNTPEDKKQFEQAIRVAAPVLDRLKAIIEEKETSMDMQEMSQTNYDNPNWAYRQAHQNGFRQCLTSYKKLLTLDQQKENTNDPKLIRTQG